ncbi:phosphonate ABC transporter, permease protein PhnE [Rhodovulum sulfidophilum]|uniref:phosphonate ABC transporter, permease protein PhnE n=1 Tax=Rhodovulum sulfidophilum TaxID=35806 RepID=UPI001923CF09|nr:phosphonate ABC transporter, permease protein PhnE [Rhodovulum sulfidophilum]MBL3566693.1 phosphonate ABC transporter, permease protein PhnE [Rhodovulum sulfidophilum]
MSAPAGPAALPDRWSKPRMIRNPVLRWALWLVVAAYIVGTIATLPIDWTRVSEGFSRAARIFGGSIPPNFERSGLLVDGFLESLKIAVLASFGGVLISVPAAFMAARNIAPLPVFYLGRALIIVARSFHPVIVAILFVKTVGFGPLAGVLTLIVYSIGFVAKMLAERIEEIDFGQVEALRATGAPYLSVLFYAIFPQILPRLIGLSIYQLDSNLRASAMIGIVGAGGIGATLANAFGRYDYDFALAITIVIVGAILVSEAISGQIRKRI